jgi:hypothetical protein
LDFTPEQPGLKITSGAASKDRGQFSLGAGIGFHPTLWIEYPNESNFFIFENNYVSASLLKCLHFPDITSRAPLRAEIRIEGIVPHIHSPEIQPGWATDPLNGIVGIDANISLYTLHEFICRKKLFQFGRDVNGFIGSINSGAFQFKGSINLRTGTKSLPIFLDMSLNAFRGVGVKNGFAGIDLMLPTDHQVVGTNFGPVTITKIVVDLCRI